MLVAIIASLAATLRVTNALTADAVIINLAGRQRMLIQESTKATLASTAASS